MLRGKQSIIQLIFLFWGITSVMASGIKSDSTEKYFRSPMLLKPQATPVYNNLYRSRHQDYDFRYIELGGGIAVWQTSHEPKMENQNMALHFYGEYGDLQKPLSYVVGANVKSTYLQENFQLAPNYYFAHLKYSPTRMYYGWPVWFNLYGIAGLSAWNAKLNYVGRDFNNYDAGRENKWGAGFVTGVGATFEFLSLTLSGQFSYFYGKGQYEGGGFEPQDVYTGSAQFNILLGYRFWLGESLWKCPTYK
ncbi:hypothetical protein R9C00_28490 [Flammeovirgaceae bacterium SG7u.111]|nr:hypothetical protein [Flammeovirgaceae bacterium SG7u.132]WPO35640.1 hypothetical protein R9C00_28490 [Flammeovirgaceae bacterium SG7u.111]